VRIFDSGRQAVLVKQSAEAIAAVDMGCGGRRWRDRWPTRDGRAEAQRSMRPVTIVMINEHPEDALKMLAVRDQQPVQTLGANGPNEAFRHRVRCRRLSRRPHHVKAGAAKDRVEPTREFLIAISDEEPRWVDPLSERPRELAGLLRHPLCIRMARTARYVDATARQLNEEQHVQSLEPDGLHREEVDGEHRARV
jgi:hypothetical protein